MHRYLKSLILFLALIAAPLAAAYDGKKVETLEIKFSPLPKGSEFNPQIVKKQLRTKEGGAFSQREFDEDLKFLSTQYRKVSPKVEEKKGKLHLTVTLAPKPTIRSIQFQGNTQVKNASIKKRLETKEGAPFDETDFNAKFQEVKTMYFKKGYFEAEVTYEVQEVIDDDYLVDIIICVDEGRAGKIRKVCFNGFTSREEDQLVEQLLLQKYSLFFSWLTGNGQYNEEFEEQDRLLITHFLQNRGYADAEVTIEIVDSPKSSERIDVIITADRGELYQVGEITISGYNIFDEKTVRAALVLRTGDPFSPDNLRMGIQHLSQVYGSKGYIEAYASYYPTLNPETRTYDIDIQITEGNQYRVGIIKVYGNVSTQTKVILHECLLTPGEVFNSSLLRKTEMRLHNVGYFSNVNVYPVKSDADAHINSLVRDVHIEVEETETASIGFAFGVSSSELINGTLQYTEKNFNYKGIPCLFTDGYQAVRGGGEFATISANLGQKRTSYHVGWSKPHFNDTPWTFGFELNRSHNRAFSDDYNIISTGLTIYGHYTLNAFTRLSTHYRIKDSDIPTFQGASQALQAEAENDGLISAAGVGVNYDSTNDMMRPTCGLRSALDFEVAGIGGDHHFLSLFYTNSYYQGLSSRGVVKYRFDMKYIYPLADTTVNSMPLDERLYLGGPDSIRGFRAYHVGPRFATGEPQGGLSSNLLSVEYDHQVNKRLNAFAFVDSGQLSLDKFSFGDYRCSIGLGARFKFFMNGPPITVGYGFPVNPDSDADVKRFFFNLGVKF